MEQEKSYVSKFVIFQVGKKKFKIWKEKNKRNDRLTKKTSIFRQEQDLYFSHSVFFDAWELGLLSRNLEMQNGLKTGPSHIHTV